MQADFLKDSLHFKEGTKGLYYKKIDGFLYTVDPTADDEVILYINFSGAQEETKKAIIQFLKENIDKLLKVRIVKNGIKATLSPDALNKKNYILKTAEQISHFLKEQGLFFSSEKPEIAYKNNMYIFLEEISEIDEVNEPEEAVGPEEENESTEPEETPEAQDTTDEKKPSFLAKIPTQVFLIIIYVLCAVVFMLLSLVSVNIAGVSGYLMGWLPTELLVKRGYKNKKIFWLVTVLSFITLLFTGAYSFLCLFLSQDAIYTVSEFFVQDLSFAYCAFNVVLGLLLSIFGTYSTLPATKKAKKVEKDDDFA